MRGLPFATRFYGKNNAKLEASFQRVALKNIYTFTVSHQTRMAFYGLRQAAVLKKLVIIVNKENDPGFVSLSSS